MKKDSHYAYGVHKLAELIPYANNSRTHTDKQIAAVAASIREFGFTNPVLIDEDGGIIAGHGRVLAAQRLELSEVPCITLAGLTEAQKKAYVIADNALAEQAGWDHEKLALELEHLREVDFDIELLGLDGALVADLLDEGPDLDPDNPYTREIEAPVYEPGETKPELSELVSEDKTAELIERIRASSVTDDEKAFLIAAAQRHSIFDFSKIADYYAHSGIEMQDLMEQSALVIIDFQSAIQGGFVDLSKKIIEQYSEDYPDEG
jgi:hypothetical protein